jgi:hypothetical protein
VPIYEDEVLEADLTVAARLVVEGKPSSRSLTDFVQRQAFFILWPFARVYFDQLASLAGVQLPPLPLLAIPQGVNLTRPQS